MIPVSNAWKSFHTATLQPEMFVEITYTITEPGLQDEPSITATDAENFADIVGILDTENANGEKYATLDYGCWGLDGSYGYSDGTPKNPGYVGKSYSDESGQITSYPTFTLDFAKKHDILIPGIMVTWDSTFGGWATDFRVTAYDSLGVVAQKVVRGNTSVVSEVFFDVVDYSRIVIEVLGWSYPYQRVRCMGIILGVQKVYGKSDLLGFEHTQSVDFLSATLPSSSVNFRLRNDDGRWNPDNPVSYEKYLLEQQEIRVRYGMDVGGDIEWIPCGTFWLSEWNTPANGLEAVFTATDRISFLNSEYTGIRVGSLYDIAVAALSEANLDHYYVAEKLKDYTTDFSDDGSKYTIAEILQVVANAGCCVFYQDRYGFIRVEPRNEAYGDYVIDQAISYSHPEYTISKPVKSISVEYGLNGETVDIPVGLTGEIQTVSNPLITTQADALRVGEVTKELLQNRKVITGEFRSDLRMDALDTVIAVSKYAANVLGITDVTYSTSGGSFRGKYTGRIVSVNLVPLNIYSAEFYSGEVW